MFYIFLLLFQIHSSKRLTISGAIAPLYKLQNICLVYVLLLIIYIMSLPNRIPYNVWVNSQLSVAKYYWWITIEWKEYVLDYGGCTVDNWKLEITPEWETYFPDLVIISEVKKP